jgi:hypothetical protein
MASSEDAEAMERKLQEKLAKKAAKKEAKEKERNKGQHELDVKAIEEKRFTKEMERDDPKGNEEAAKVSADSREANDAGFLLEYAALLASRAAAKAQAVAKEEAKRLALIPNPHRDWKCNGCNKVNTVVPGQVKKKREQKKKPAKKKKGPDDDSTDSDDEAPPAVVEEEIPDPVARCHHCGVKHTYVPRGKRGMVVMSTNALSATFEALKGDDWVNRKGWLRAMRLSDWHGISADDHTDRGSGAVLKVELIENGLSGDLPSALCKLTSLTHLLLDQNPVTGSLPAELVNLVNLKFLSLCGCKLTGYIPDSICAGLTSLRTLALAGNALTGTIPDSISAIDQLRSLWLQDNRLCGTIPPLGPLDELRQMDVSNNSLGGEIPFDINGCRELQRFDVSHNFMDGVVPSTMGRLSKLTCLNLSYNR